ncbi:MAG: dienelactone hydrolase family protein [Chitinophagaceae bacterium]|nr:dienelactone hydrolase family protein [Chitinophagaceae bacterium]
MKNKIILLVVLIFVSINLSAQDKSLYKKEILVVNNDTMPYRILLPLNYDPSKKYPFILLLHGAGERGNDNENQLVHGSGLFLTDSIREKYPAIVVFPQCPANSFWSNIQFKADSAGNRSFYFQEAGEPTIAMDLAQQLLKKIIKDYPVNKKQIYVGGLSMGGMGTFEIVRRNPKLFAAAFPICGGANPATASKLTKVKWWVFHGAADAVVPPEWSQKMVDALQKINADVKFSLYPGVNHNSWDNAFAEPTLMSWLFSISK